MVDVRPSVYCQVCGGGYGISINETDVVSVIGPGLPVVLNELVRGRHIQLLHKRHLDDVLKVYVIVHQNVIQSNQINFHRKCIGSVQAVQAIDAKDTLLLLQYLPGVDDLVEVAKFLQHGLIIQLEALLIYYFGIFVEIK